MATMTDLAPTGYRWTRTTGGWDFTPIDYRPGLSFGGDVFGDQAEYDNQYSTLPTVRCPHCGANLATPDRPSAHSNH